MLLDTLTGLAATLAVMVPLWAVSVWLRDVSIVDLFWGPVIAVAATVYFFDFAQSPRALVMLVCVWLWALRLGIYLAARNWGKDEDRRYAEMRERHDPGFWYKSLFLVFGLQAVLAWIVSLPAFGAMRGGPAFGLLDLAGVLLFAFGLIWESVADYQLAHFLRNRTNSDAVMDKGVWRYSRHPNYFGEFCLWWGLWLLSVASGQYWTIVGPLLLSYFLLKVSGVSMLEKDISERRPAYREYVRRTSAFVPMPPRD